jgi:heme oxygenase (biliverdin-IX-beta and delta-forming)
MVAPHADPVLPKIRAGTAELHETLETSLDLLRPDLTVHHFVAFLEGMYGYYRAWEERVWPVLMTADSGLMRGRRKAELLKSDLAGFGVSSEEVPLCRELPSISSPSEAIGSLYVLEGSTLGGQLLLRHFGRTLQLGPDQLSFLHGYGEQTGSMWKAYCLALERHANPENQSQIIRAAQDTFRTMTTWLTTARPAQN